MIRPQDFKISVDWVENAALVRVRHEPSGRELEGRPSQNESVGQLTHVLLTRLQSEFLRPEEWHLEQMQASGEDDHRGTVYRLTHLPSGKFRTAADHEVEALGGWVQVSKRWMDEIAEELWAEGYYSNSSSDLH